MNELQNAYEDAQPIIGQIKSLNLTTTLQTFNQLTQAWNSIKNEIPTT